jgi:hypothetical protein
MEVGGTMKAVRLSRIAIAAALVVGISHNITFAQDTATKDIKKAGTETKDAAKDTGHAVSKGSEKAYHKTVSGTKEAADKTSDASKTVAHKTSTTTKKTVDKVEGKPAPQ